MEKIKKGTDRNLELTSRIVLFSGIIVLLSCLTWMILNLDKADSIISIWSPIMFAGSLLIFNGLLIQFMYKRNNR